MIWIIAYIVSSMISLGVLYRMGRHAPIGYQDEKGFHTNKNSLLTFKRTGE